MTTLPPAARSEHPWTSHAAGVEVTRDGSRERTWQLFARVVGEHPGATAYEVGVYSGVDGIWKRAIDAERRGLIHRDGTKACPVSGKQQLRCWQGPKEPWQLEMF